MPATKGLDLPVDALAARLGDGRLERDAPLAPHTTFKIGGPADLLYRALTQDELAEAVRAARELDVPFFLLGLGANVLVSDRGFRGLVIKNEVETLDWLDDTRVRAGSGMKIYHDLIQITVAKGLGGLQHYVGIPSTVGGAVWQNLHFLSPPPERERTMFIAEVVEGATILTEEGEVREVDLDYFQFGYDYSILHDRKDVVLDVTFRLEPTPRETMRDTIRENLQWRDDRHPDLWLYPSAGSIFQKLEGIGAGRLIDQCGLKGKVLGNAQIFHKHANIIVNLGGATSADVRALIDLAQTTVKKELGHELKTEIGMIGEF
ncbi:UDP-N-acetylmuramate dehydrogenase [Longimicrobium sp.]|uniref:UDP-N-acetylmuramate dehydrogenase n=1 Tax=Longimicrobium sp. TaxID=2029185 RepID=UPI002E375B95|nr:UDP-N-acetylmuramate dehydrogenase [Longimicrobium sp.]HEX6041815.1 UDP-N-acetylmuramate dehydrogenase [Longimicrobium sp.]